MSATSFEQVRSIIRGLLSHDEWLAGLVAVLSKPSGADWLLVYVNHPPLTTTEPATAVTMARLRDLQLGEYTGPTVGLSAIDLVRPDIATKGYTFYRLDRVLRRSGRVEVLRETLAELARFLSRFLDQTPPHAGAVERIAAEIAAIASSRKIASLALPERRYMVGFLPDRDQAVRLIGADLRSLNALNLGQDEQLVALEEVRQILDPGAATAGRDRYPIELRAVLQRSVLEHAEVDGRPVDLLLETLRDVSLAFYRRWQSSRARGDQEVAYATALEAALAHSDVDDLVAVIPCDDFDAFRATGAGTYVYRTPLEDFRSQPEPGITRLALRDAIASLTDPQRPPVFALLPLRPLCSSGPGWFDIGPPLRKAGRTEILARNAWLLVQDLLGEDRAGRAALKIDLLDLYHTMVHCAAILSLTDPWRTREGRRDEWLRGSSQTLDEVIVRLAEDDPAEAAYYRALRRWYALGQPDGDDALGTGGAMPKVQDALSAIVEDLSPSEQEGSRVEPRAPSSAAGELRRVAQALHDLFGGGRQATAYSGHLRTPPAESVPQVVRRATDMSRPPALLSGPFGVSFQQYAEIDAAIWRARTMPRTVQQRITRLADCVVQLNDHKRLILGPDHEKRILEALYDNAIVRTTQLLEQLRSGAALDVRLRTRTILREIEGAAGEITIAVLNVGNVAAEQVEVELVASDAFELRGQTFKQTLASLSAEESVRFKFAIASATDAPSFSIQCIVSWSNARIEPSPYMSMTSDIGQPSTADPALRQSRTYEFIVQQGAVPSAVSGAARTGPFEMKANPYVFGSHVTDPQKFFGRRTELNELLSHLASYQQQNVVIRAPRRTGKTSLLHMIEAVLRDTDRRAGVRAWFDIPPRWDAPLNATVPVRLDLQRLGLRKASAAEFYRAVLEALHAGGLRSEWTEVVVREPAPTFAQFREGIADIVRGVNGLRLVILLDEFDVVAEMPDRLSFFDGLRTTVADVKEITWIIVSASGLYQDLHDYASPLFNVFQIKEMSRLDDEAAKALVLSPWATAADRTASLVIAEDAVETILEETGNHPWMLQMLCSEIVDHVNAIRSNVVRSSTVDQVIQQRLIGQGSAADTYFEHMWEQASGVGKLLLLALLNNLTVMRRDELAAGAIQILRAYSRPDLTAALLAGVDRNLKQLARMEAMRSSPGGYAYGVPLFRRVLAYRDSRDDGLARVAVNQLSDEFSGEHHG